VTITKSQNDAKAPLDAEALFKEARRRRRRRLMIGAAVVLSAGVIGGLVIGVGGKSPKSPAKTSGSGQTAGVIRSTRTIPFSPLFTPTQILSEAGKIWLLGSTSGLGQPQNCGIEEVDPTSLHYRTFPLPQCATYPVAGGGHIYLLGDSFVRATNTDEFHLESFDLSTGQSTVMAPVIVTTNGTGRAHMAMAYGDGWVWVYPWGDEVLQVSPTTGAVNSTIHGVGASGSGHPSVTVNSSGAYFAGWTPTITHTDPSTGTVDTFYRAPSNSQVIWISALGASIWASVSTFNTGGVPTTELYALDASGHPTLKVREQPFDISPVVSAAGRAFSVSGGCERAIQLWGVDVRARRAAVLTTLQYLGGCAGYLGSIATVGSYVFVLDNTGVASGSGFLYRFQMASS
jgi:hypothetical protein